MSRITIRFLARHLGCCERVIYDDINQKLLVRSPRMPGIRGDIEIVDANRYIRKKHHPKPLIHQAQ